MRIRSLVKALDPFPAWPILGGGTFFCLDGGRPSYIIDDLFRLVIFGNYADR